MSTAKVLVEAVCRNAIANIAAAVMPGAVVASPILRTLARPYIVSWRMRHGVVIIRRVLVRRTVMRLMNVGPIRLLMLRRARYPMVIGSGCLVVVRMLLRSLVVVRMLRRSLVAIVTTLRAAVMFVLMILRTTVMVVIVPMLCVRRSAGC